MDIQWFSPLDADQTEIARYSQQVLAALHTCTDANIVAISPGQDQTSTPEWTRQYISPNNAISPTGEAPLAIYHLGNNRNHADIVKQLFEQPGLIVLHDTNLINLAQTCTKEIPGFDWLHHLAAQYGPEALRLGKAGLTSPQQYEQLIVQYPLFKAFLANALGIIVHSNYARDIISTVYSGPIIVAKLPYPCQPALTRANYDDEVYTLIFCGHAGPNRRLTSLFKAWGAISKPGKFRLQIFGHLDDEESLLEAAATNGLSGYIDIRGFAPESELAQALQSAHLAINLRYPTMGESSASQLRFWDMGLPSLVTQIGWYSELPADTVAHVKPEHEIEDIQRILEDFLNNPNYYAAMGRRAKAYAAHQHDSANYAQQMYEFAKTCSELRLSHHFLDRSLARLIGNMCAHEQDIDLFKDASQLLVNTLEPPTD
ncbi:glycosyltransferase [Oceanicoccus sagamiensis]|uniref:Glycosyl transferase family 1 domain-containing protein n=1 Tax=Oceanicoccus sagamiensis TaxID=716816 RepID=A0A1X9NA70_9GAMM|nr:glycosyltransferase [Oceanicoccus sagamiensis]ARN74950.1 hypothetical protein BST96_12995 [Oceanicoccus sagamiensis]